MGIGLNGPKLQIMLNEWDQENKSRRDHREINCMDEVKRKYA